MTLGEAASSILSSGARIIAIDGRSASGKTSLAALVAESSGGSIVHMDDFFLPVDLRTPERLSSPGGNVHSERFIEEVLPHLARKEMFSYRRFDCSLMDYAAEPVEADASGIIVIEGAYSLSPAFGHYYDLSVFCDVDGSVQMRRIIARNGKEKAEVFRTRWIPMEELYISSCAIMEKADRIIRCCQEMGGSIPS